MAALIGGKEAGYLMSRKRILIIDGQGGGIGRLLTQSIKTEFPEVTVASVGTNVMATQAMIKAGADEAATGENAVLVGCRKADIITGPIGIIIADALMGEITPNMAVAVGQADAVRILLPVNQCDNIVVGIENNTISSLIKGCMDQIRNYLGTEQLITSGRNVWNYRK